MEQAVENNGASYKNIAEELSEVVEASNIMLVIVSGDSQKLITSTSNEWQTNEMYSQLLGYLLGRNQARGELLQEEDHYQIRSTIDILNADEYIEMWGFLNVFYQTLFLRL